MWESITTRGCSCFWHIWWILTDALGAIGAFFVDGKGHVDWAAIPMGLNRTGSSLVHFADVDAH